MQLILNGRKGDHMKVKEYLVNRILELEREVYKVRSESDDFKADLDQYKEDNCKLVEKINQLEIEHEHIKQIITCNVVEDLYTSNHYVLDLMEAEDDFQILMSILDIKPEDYGRNTHITCKDQNDNGKGSD